MQTLRHHPRTGQRLPIPLARLLLLLWRPPRRIRINSHHTPHTPRAHMSRRRYLHLKLSNRLLPERTRRTLDRSQTQPVSLLRSRTPLALLSAQLHRNSHSHRRSSSRVLGHASLRYRRLGHRRHSHRLRERRRKDLRTGYRMWEGLALVYWLCAVRTVLYTCVDDYLACVGRGGVVDGRRFVVVPVFGVCAGRSAAESLGGLEGAGHEYWRGYWWALGRVNCRRWSGVVSYFLDN